MSILHAPPAGWRRLFDRRPAERCAWTIAGLGLLLGVSLVWPAAVAAETPSVLDAEALVDAFPTVVVQMTVLDQRRQPYAGLSVDTVAIDEDNQRLTPTRVSTVGTSPTPLSLIFAVDTSQTMSTGQLDSTVDNIKLLLSRLRSTDRASIVRFGAMPALAQAYTSDSVGLSQALDRLSAEGNRRLYDGIYLAVAEAARTDGNRAVIVITSGEDSQSQLALGSIKNIVADLNVKLYIIGLGSQVRDDLLENLAIGSRGRYYKAPQPSDLAATLRAAHTDITSRYEIVYSSRLRNVQTGDRVVAQLTLGAPGSTATASVAYRAPRGVGATAAEPDRRPTTPQPVVTRPIAPAIDDRLILLGGALTGLGLVTAVFGLLMAQRRAVRERRLQSYISTATYTYVERPPSLLQLATALLVRGVAAVLIRLLPPNQVRQISHRLLLAGSPYSWRVSHFVTLKGILTVVGLFVGLLFPSGTPITTLILPLTLATIGFITPDVWLNNQVRIRQRQVLRALPSALDLLAISVEAGMSLDGAMLEVVHKWRNPLGDEFANVLADLKVGKSRREALRGLVHRTNVPEVNSFVSAVIQADEIGLSISRTLVIQAEQMRIRQRQRAERLAREASVKMLFPMAALIFPAIFVVILVPALPTIVESLRSIGGG